jgi:hypothetical protein
MFRKMMTMVVVASAMTLTMVGCTKCSGEQAAEAPATTEAAPATETAPAAEAAAAPAEGATEAPAAEVTGTPAQ